MNYLKFSVFVMLYCIVCSNVGAQEKSSEKTKDVTIRYVGDEEKGIPNQMIHFAYYDVKSSSWKTSKEKTDANGYAKFKVAVREDGASCSFFYTTKDEEAFKSMVKEADNDRIRLMRLIPEDDLLELWVYKSGNGSNKKGAVQFWSKE